MIQIAYAPSDAELAEHIQRDLAAERLDLDHDYLLILLTPSALTEHSIIEAIDNAQNQNYRLAPLLIKPTPMPPSLQGVRPLNLTRGYRKGALVSYLKHLDRGESLNRANRRALILALFLVLFMCSVSIFLIGGGVVRFPQREFNNQETLEAATRDFFLRPTLEAFQPRTTQDAQFFEATARAVPTYVRPFLVMTATQIAPHERQFR